MADAPDRLEVGRVHKAHGLKGDVNVSLTTDRLERVEPGARLFVAGVEHEVARSTTQPPDRWIVGFVGVTDRTAAEALRGAALTAEPLDADEGEIWVHELVGATVALPDGTAVGVVESVQDNPAHDLLVLDTGDLVPVVFVVDGSDLPERVVIDPPEGLLGIAET
ncbi:MAG TPA: ribosome maturation factor RimM [Iamia sp.]|jgi:16S rRNA processing protein RimM|nr:ribosome maturation factor RimM [Iamia sp.]